VHHQRSQAQFLRFDCEIGAVDTAAQPDDTVVVATASFRLDGVHDQLELAPAFLIWEPVGSEDLIEMAAVRTNARFVERNLGVGRVHDAAGAHPSRN
jgi:hypothetical protein